MAMLGLRLLGFEAPPTYPQLKQLIVFVEMDRCTGDAVAFVTSAKLGRRSLKFVDYGIMAATFVNLGTDHAFRIISTEESRDLAALYAPGEPDRRQQQTDGLQSHAGQRHVSGPGGQGEPQSLRYARPHPP